MGATTSSPQAPNLSGTEWKKIQLTDSFTGTGGDPPNGNTWIMQTGTQYPGGPAQWGTGEIESYTNSASNVRQSGYGGLIITPQKSSSGQWTSARIETKRNDFAAPAGGKLRVEAMISLPNVTSQNGLGYWPAFWMIGGDFRSNYTNWPAVGEIDIMETCNGSPTVISSLHCDINPGGTCNEPTGLGSTDSCSGSNCPGNNHIYEVIIDRSVSPEVVQYYVDRVLVHTVSQTDLGTALWAKTIQKGFYLVMNVAIGGGYPNAVAGISTPTANTVSGAQMFVDYVGIWTTS